MRLFSALIFTAIVITNSACTSPHPDTALFEKQLFDFDWNFQLTDDSAAIAPNYDDSDWRQLDLPHDWSIEGTIAADNPMGNDGGYFPTGIGWYRKIFEVPADWKGQVVSIEFGGVYMNSEVYINGQFLGKKPYGYTAFSYDLTPYLKYGEQNVIAVKVDNSIQKNCRWYSGSGIYRHVWLNVENPVHFEKWGVTITTPQVSDEQALIMVNADVVNESEDSQELIVEVTVKDDLGNSTHRDDFSFQPKAIKNTEFEIELHNPHLWSPDDPYLYTAEVILKDQEGQILDKMTEHFGIRSIEYSAEKGFLLNGKSILLNGGCVHHDNGSLGTKAYDRAEERKVELLKNGGFNAVRTSHNPPSEAFLDACDRLGLLVIDEAFDGWRSAKAPQAPFDYSLHFDEWWQRDIEAMVLRDKNHPSIVMWSIGNEIIERTEPQAVETARMLANHVRKLDSTRPVTSAMTTWGQGWEIFDPLMAEHDIAGYNYQLWRAEDDHKRVPDRVIVNTESYPKNAFFIWDLVDKHPYIIGDFVWTAIDYLGESGIGRYFYPGELTGQHWEKDFFPIHGAYCGDIDLIGWRKPINHYRSMLYNDHEKLYMAVKEPSPDSGDITVTDWGVWPTWESWKWPGYEGKTIQVEVYSKYSAVRLYLNDVLIGQKPTNREEQFKAVFDVVYESGTLKAVGIDDGAEVENTILETAGEAHAIKLTPDRTELFANGQDLSFVWVEVVDSEGQLVPNADHLLHFTISGEGVIEGVDNSNLADEFPYVSNERKACNGRAMVVVKSTRKSGEIILKVKAEGLDSGEVKMYSSK